MSPYFLMMFSWLYTQEKRCHYGSFFCVKTFICIPYQKSCVMNKLSLHSKKYRAIFLECGAFRVYSSIVTFVRVNQVCISDLICCFVQFVAHTVSLSTQSRKTIPKRPHDSSTTAANCATSLLYYYCLARSL